VVGAAHQPHHADGLVILRAGGYEHASRLGRIMLERRVDGPELELLVRTLELAGLTPGDVCAVEITEGGAMFDLAPRR
jgi:hypothetical protein